MSISATFAGSLTKRDSPAVTISCQDYAPSLLVPNAAYENCNLWMNAHKGASFLPHVSRFDSVDTGRANELYFSNQHSLKPVTAFQASSIDRLHRHLGFPFGEPRFPNHERAL